MLRKRNTARATLKSIEIKYNEKHITIEVLNNIFSIMNNKIENILLHELISNEILSVRSVNLCEDNGLIYLKQILNFYEKGNSFMSLRKCGKKTEKELVEFCRKYKKNEAPNEPYSFSPIQENILNNQIIFLISTLSERAKNGLLKNSNKLIPAVIYKDVFIDNVDFNIFVNIGIKAAKELSNFKNNIVNFAESLKKLNNTELDKEYIKLIVKTTFEKCLNNFDEDLDNLFYEDGRLKIFSLLDILINSGIIFTETQHKTFIFLYSDNEDRGTLESIAIEEGITKERVRQIKAKLESNIHSYFSFISNFMVDISKYDIDTEKNILIIDQAFSQKLNQIECVNFNNLFYNTIFSIITNKSHVSLTKSLINRVGKIKTTNNEYLIKAIVFKCFNFEKFITDVFFKLNAKVEETYYLHFKGYLSEFINISLNTNIEDIINICEIILLKEFELVVSNDGYLFFEKNTKKHKHQYYYEILEENGDWMKISEITLLAKNKFPFLESKDSSVRGILNKEKELFIYKGRSSTYGLRKWVELNENHKGGTIRDIIYEFLSKNDTPLHIGTIFEYVSKYREDTYPRSILDNLKAEANNTFIFYSGGFIGIKNKNYNSLNTNVKNLSGSYFTKTALRKYNNWNFDDLINFFCMKHGYLSVQVVYILRQKIIEGTIKLTHDNKIIS